MSMVKRLAQGNLAALCTMAFNIVAQVLIVPVFLSHWSAATYGIWIAVITTMSLLTMVDVTHQDYLGFESMRLGPQDRLGRSAIISDAIPVIVVTGFLQSGLLLALIYCGLSYKLFGINQTLPLSVQASSAIVALFVLWCVYQNFAGILVRVITSLGYFAVGAWWGLVNAIGAALGPMTAVILGATFFQAAVTQMIMIIIINTAVYIHYWYLLKANGIVIQKPQSSAGFNRYAHSLVLSAANIIEFMQQTGFRLAILPLIGAQRLVQFSTHRTVANVAQQGVGTLINPALPELMRLIEGNEKTKVQALLSFIFYFTVILACPAFVFLQLIVGEVFSRWTAGKVQFDANTFIALSIAVLFYCISQPSRAIIRGHNLVREQAFVSIITGIIVVFLAVKLVVTFGVFGAAVCLLSAELIRAALNTGIAYKLLSARGMDFPRSTLVLSLLLVGASAWAMVLISRESIPRAYTMALFCIVWFIVNFALWYYTPSSVRVILRLRVRSIGQDVRARAFSRRSEQR